MGAAERGREYKEGRSLVGPFNFHPSVQGGYKFPSPLTIIDSTHRKIMLTNGLRPSVDDMLHVAEALEKVGVKEIIYNVDWWGDEKPEKLEFEVAKGILSRGFAFRAAISTDSYVPYPIYDVKNYPVTPKQVVETLLEIGMKCLEPPVIDPVDPGLRDLQVEQLEEAFGYAQSQGVECIMALQDVGRVDFDWLVRMANEGIRLGAVRVDLLDSLNSISPEAMKFFISEFIAGLSKPIPVSLHVHDDFGLGSACAIAAATAGALPDVAVNGMSYRSGHASLEEVVLALELLYGVPTGIRIDRLQWLSDQVAKYSGLPVPPLKPIVGSQAYLRDIPPWVVPIIRNGPDGFPAPGSCIVPSIVGARLKPVWGNHHSNWVIREKLAQMKLAASEEQIKEIRQKIEDGVNAKTSYPRWLTEEEVEDICKTTIVA